MAGDDPRRHQWPCRRCRARLTDPSPLLARRSALWRERWSLCRWHWRAIRSGGCDGTPWAGRGAGIPRVRPAVEQTGAARSQIGLTHPPDWTAMLAISMICFGHHDGFPRKIVCRQIRGQFDCLVQGRFLYRAFAIRSMRHDLPQRSGSPSQRVVRRVGSCGAPVLGWNSFFGGCEACREAGGRDLISKSNAAICRHQERGRIDSGDTQARYPEAALLAPVTQRMSAGRGGNPRCFNGLPYHCGFPQVRIVCQRIRGAFRSQFCGRQSVNPVLIAIENRVRLSERIGQFMN